MNNDWDNDEELVEPVKKKEDKKINTKIIATGCIIIITDTERATLSFNRGGLRLDSGTTNLNVHSAKTRAMQTVLKPSPPHVRNDLHPFINMHIQSDLS